LEENKRYWTHLSAAYLDIGDSENALESARRAYALDTSYAPAIYYLGAAFDAAEMHDSALWCFSRTVSLEPNHHPSRHDLAMALLRSKKIDEAIEQINIAINLAPDSARYHGALGWILLEGGRFKEAEPILRRAIQMDRRCVPALVNLIRLYQQTGRNKQALLELTKLKKRPGLPHELRLHLEDIEEAVRKALFPAQSAG
jgi:tetratricopeptide (TPR) repeat protein